MSNYRERLLAEVCTLCRQLFELRLARTRTQDRVSGTARTNAVSILDGFDRIIILAPFPGEGSVDESPLSQLKTAIANPDHDPEDRERILIDWLNGVAPAGAPAEAEKADPATIAPINQRMLDATARLRRSIDASRVRLLRSGDRYDRAAYTAARNDFTLARAAYDRRLQNNTITPTVEDASRAESELNAAISGATGTTFPGAIQAAANFMSKRTFVLA